MDDESKEMAQREPSEDLCFTEIERVEKAGTEVWSKHIKMSALLGLTRAFGDFHFKSQAELGGLDAQVVIVRPIIRIVERSNKKREVLGLLTDGLAFSWKETDIFNKIIEKSTDDSLRMAVQPMYDYDTGDQMSLEDAAKSLHSNAEKHGNGDIAGLILVKFDK